MILLDTNVVSGLMAPKPPPLLIDWLNATYDAWTRQLALVFGSSELAIATVLAARPERKKQASRRRKRKSGFTGAV